MQKSFSFRMILLFIMGLLAAAVDAISQANFYFMLFFLPSLLFATSFLRHLHVLAQRLSPSLLFFLASPFFLVCAWLTFGCVCLLADFGRVGYGIGISFQRTKWINVRYQIVGIYAWFWTFFHMACAPGIFYNLHRVVRVQCSFGSGIHDYYITSKINILLFYEWLMHSTFHCLMVIIWRDEDSPDFKLRDNDKYNNMNSPYMLGLDRM